MDFNAIVGILTFAVMMIMVFAGIPVFISMLVASFGGFIVIVLMLYFMGSLPALKSAMYRLVPASKRPTFIRIAEEIMTSIGRFVTGQFTLGLINGVGHVKLNFVIALADGVVARIGLSLLLAVTFGMGLHGYWWGSALAGFVSSIWSFAYYFSGRWQTRQVLG